MKVNYRGFEIKAERDKCLAGYSLLYFSVCSLNDGYEWICSFENSEEMVRDKINQLKEWADNWHKDVKNNICPECGKEITKTMNGNKYCEDCDMYYDINKLNKKSIS